MKKVQGSFSLEAVIVMSSVLIILFAVLYAFTLIYQNVVIMYSASTAAQQGAKEWTENNGLYYNLQELAGGDIGAKKSEIQKSAEKLLQGGIMSASSSTVNVEFDNSLADRAVTVEIRQKISIPFGLIAKFFNNGNDLELKAKARASIVEPTEYIRNIDYAIEWVTVISDWVGDKLGEAVGNTEKGSKILDIIGKLGF